MREPTKILLEKILRLFLEADLKKEEKEFIQDNISKHQRIIWINILTATFVLFSLGNYSGDRSILIAAMIAPAMITGGAWFAVSFGGIPAKLIQTALQITF